MKFNLKVSDSTLKKVHQISVESNKTLLKSLLEHKIPMNFSCDQNATCGTCQVKIISGKVTPVNSLESEFALERNLLKDERLSCQTYALSDLEIII